MSERHVWRILAEYRKEGAAALAHGNRGRRANNSIPEEARTQVVTLARTRYARVNHTHLTELLAEREEIVLGRSTVRRILVGAGMASPRRRRPPLHRVRRQRMSQEGMLVQVDGSVHAWLEERGPRCTLLLAIDDATSTVPYALFRHEEDTHGYFLLMQELIRAFVGFLWPCTVTATPSSSMYLARINRLRRPNSVVRWQSLGWSRSSRVLRRRRVG